LRDQNVIFIIGRLTRDPELRYTPTNRAVASFTLANNRDYVSGGNRVEKVSFFDCVAWNKLAEVVAQYLKKGKLVAVTGELQQRRWEDNDGKHRSKIEIVVSEIQMLDKKDSDPVHQQREEEPFPSFEDACPSNVYSDEDLPF
jgi:single-strand DNA-binding protein